MVLNHSLMEGISNFAIKDSSFKVKIPRSLNFFNCEVIIVSDFQRILHRSLLPKYLYRTFSLASAGTDHATSKDSVGYFSGFAAMIVAASTFSWRSSDMNW